MENPFENSEKLSTDGAEVVKRPQLLTVLCILTFIGSGFTLLSNLIVMFVGDGFMVMMEEASGGMLDDSMGAALELAKRMAPLTSLLLVVSLVGAVMMFMLKRIGFFLYAGAQLAAVFIPLTFGGTLSWGGVLLALVFIVLYALNFKALK